MSSSNRSASLTLIVGGCLWGLFWLPLRQIESGGSITGGWAGTSVYAGALLLILPIALININRLATNAWPLLQAGVLAGAALSLYTASLLATDEVRAVLLFYLTPIWSTILGALFLGERVTIARAGAILLGLAGAVVVLGGKSGIPVPSNTGDWMALLSGMAWALASLSLYRMEKVAVSDQVVAMVIGCLVVSVLLLPVSGGGVSLTTNAVFWVALSAAYVLPMLVMTLWPATVLSPARVGILLMSEIVVGVASAAWLAGEPFGARELVGTALILSATCAELFGQPRRQFG